MGRCVGLAGCAFGGAGPLRAVSLACPLWVGSAGLGLRRPAFGGWDWGGRCRVTIQWAMFQCGGGAGPWDGNVSPLHAPGSGLAKSYGYIYKPRHESPIGQRSECFRFQVGTIPSGAVKCHPIHPKWLQPLLGMCLVLGGNSYRAPVLSSLLATRGRRSSGNF